LQAFDRNKIIYAAQYIILRQRMLTTSGNSETLKSHHY